MIFMKKKKIEKNPVLPVLRVTAKIFGLALHWKSNHNVGTLNG